MRVKQERKIENKETEKSMRALTISKEAMEERRARKAGGGRIGVSIYLLRYRRSRSTDRRYNFSAPSTHLSMLTPPLLYTT